MEKQFSNLNNRILIGLTVLALAIYCNYWCLASWASVMLLVSILAFREFKALCNNMGVYPLASWIYFFIAAFVLVPLIIISKHGPGLVYTSMLTLMIASYVIIFPRVLLKTTYTRFEDLTASLWAVFQFGLFPSFFIWLRAMEHGFAYTMIVVLTIAANDTGSLLFGKLFGKTKLAPQISPGKTVEGSIGGLLCGITTFYGFSNLFNVEINQKFFGYYHWLSAYIDGESFRLIILVALALLLSIVAQIGDLLVSALKRAAGVKDSGTLLLSHGGVLDRMDSHLFAAWFAYFIFAYLLV